MHQFFFAKFFDKIYNFCLLTMTSKVKLDLQGKDKTSSKPIFGTKHIKQKKIRNFKLKFDSNQGSNPP